MCDAADCTAAWVPNFQSTAGRVDDAVVTTVKGSLTVGYYDPKFVPAVNIFGGVGCTGASRRLYSSADKDKHTVEYHQNRVGVVTSKKNANIFTSDVKAEYAKSAMVPHGYRLSVYAADNFK